MHEDERSEYGEETYPAAARSEIECWLGFASKRASAGYCLLEKNKKKPA